MSASFLATAAFAVVVLGMIFLANLVALVFTGSQWHVAGVVCAVLGAAVAYWAQHLYTQAAISRDEAGFPAVIQAMEASGYRCQLVAVVVATAGVVAFVLGMQK